MRRGKRFWARLSNLFRKSSADAELEREIAAHLALIAEDFERRGMSPRDAMLAARRTWGGVEQSKELHRDERSFVAVEQFLQDLRHAVRSLAKSRGFTTVALLSLAFGIGVNTAIFTLVNGILLKKLPVRNPRQIVQITGQLPEFEAPAFSFPAFREIRRQNAIFQEVIGVNLASQNLSINGGDPVRVDFEMITGGYFAFFGARPAAGRLLDEEDDRVEGAHRVCVISYDAWQRLFSGASDAVGRRVMVGNNQLEIVGVAPRHFAGAELQRRYDVWVPSALIGDFSNPRESGNHVWLRVMARLQPGISLAQANARLAVASGGIDAALPKDHTNELQVLKAHDGANGLDSWRTYLREPLVLLMAVVTLVLLMACANLANLLLARTHERRQEFAIKLSLGISRWRLLRQLLLETLLLAFAGCVLAMAVSDGLTRFLLAVFNTGNSLFPLHVAPDRSVLLYAFAGCTLTALIAGVYPAWNAARIDAGDGLKGGQLGRGSKSTMRRGLILVQVTLTVVLLFGAGLFTHSLRNLKTIDLGYDVDHVINVTMLQRGSTRAQKKSKGSPQLLEVLARARQLPGVESASLADRGFLGNGMASAGLTISDSPGGPRDLDNVYFVFESPGYLATLRMSLLKGRDFNGHDVDGAPSVAIVNQQFASLAWPGLDPIGRHISGGWGAKDAEVVGLVGNAKFHGVRDETRPVVALPFAQVGLAGATLQVRFRGAASQIERDVRQLVRSAAPAYQVYNTSAMDALRDATIARDRLMALLSDLFGGLGVALALVGIYGLISFSVTRRTREIGIRMSIGAQRGDVIWLFLREIAALVALGLLLGMPLALTLSQYVGKLLYQVSPADPAAIVITIALVAAGAMLAATLPARRATRVNPVQALRYD
jgi:predicted permease